MTLPTDPFGQDKPLIYRRTSDTFTLYSVGPDGKDDGGQAIVRAKNAPVASRKGIYDHYVEAGSSGDMVAGINF